MIDFNDVDITDIDAVRKHAEQAKSKGYDFDTYDSAFNKAWGKSQKGAVRPEIKEVIKGIFKQSSEESIELYYPGHIHIAEVLMRRAHFKTLSDNNNERPEVYAYNSQIYVRAEEHIKQVAEAEYIRQWSDTIKEGNERIEELPEDAKAERGSLRRIIRKCTEKLDTGPTVADINEVVATIRRRTYTPQSEINPASHIACLNGLLNIETWELEDFTPDLFFNTQVNANYLRRFVRLSDTPLYINYLLDVYDPKNIPAVLEYDGYSFWPLYPRHKVNFVVGRQRIGKGVRPRILRELHGEGYATTDLNRLLTTDRFWASGIEAKHRLICDPEISRTFRKGSWPNWRNFNTLFGGDSIQIELKFKEVQTTDRRPKGLYIGNLPLFKNENAASLNRMLLMQTKNERETPEITDLHKLILSRERDAIFSLLMRYLRVLKSQNWYFINESSEDDITELWQKLDDPIGNWLDECVSYVQGAEIKVDDTFKAFDEYCRVRGIPTPSKQTFTSRVKDSYPKKRGGPKGKRFYIFTGLMLEPDESEGTAERSDTVRNSRGAQKQRPAEIRKAVSNLRDEGDQLRPHDYWSRGYASVQTVIIALRDWGLDVEEYDRRMYSKNEYKARIKGKMSDFSDEVQDFINSSFKVVFPGSIDAPHTWINFAIKPRGDDLSPHD